VAALKNWIPKTAADDSKDCESCAP
jgi:hypothetical protein